jgi:hypothetical protein
MDGAADGVPGQADGVPSDPTTTIARDLPDLVAFLMATGLRIGEICGRPGTPSTSR